MQEAGMRMSMMPGDISQMMRISWRIAQMRKFAGQTAVKI